MVSKVQWPSWRLDTFLSWVLWLPITTPPCDSGILADPEQSWLQASWMCAIRVWLCAWQPCQGMTEGEGPSLALTEHLTVTLYCAGILRAWLGSPKSSLVLPCAASGLPMSGQRCPQWHVPFLRLGLVCSALHGSLQERCSGSRPMSKHGCSSDKRM